MAAAAVASRQTHRQYRIQRKVASIPVVAGGFGLQDLPRSYDYEAVFFRIQASLQVTVAATSVRAEAPTQIVPRVEIVSDGKNTLLSAPFWSISLARYERDLIFSGARVTTPPSAVGIATYAVEAIGVHDFMTADGTRPKDSNFRTSALSMFQTRLTFGQAGDSFVGGTVNFTGTNNVDVFTAEIVELPAADGSYSLPMALKKVSFFSQAFAASNANAEMRLPAGNLIKSVVLRADGGTTAGEPSLSLNNVKLQSGVDVRLDLAAANLRAKNNADFGGTILAGYYIADVTSKGTAKINLSDLWDVTGQAEPKVIVDITGGANVTLTAVVTEYILARRASS
jgi:hypothetical protein